MKLSTFIKLPWWIRSLIRSATIYRYHSSLPGEDNARTADDYVHLAKSSFEDNRQVGPSLKYTRKAVELDPNHAEANSLLAWEYMSVQDYAAALGPALIAVAASPQDMFRRSQLAEIYEKLGRFDEALAEYLRLAYNDENNAGNVHVQAYRLDVSSWPGNHVSIARCLSGLGRHEEAAESYRTALSKANKNDPRGYAADTEWAAAYAHELQLSGHVAEAISIWNEISAMPDLLDREKRQIAQWMRSAR